MRYFKVAYRIVLFLLYFVGAFWCASLLATRAVFLSWPPEYDPSLLVLVLVVYFSHFLLLWIGHKKNWLDLFVVCALMILDLILYGPQLFILTYDMASDLTYDIAIGFKSGFFDLSFDDFLPNFAVGIPIIILRLFAFKNTLTKLKARDCCSKTAGSSPVSSEADPADKPEDGSVY